MSVSVTGEEYLLWFRWPVYPYVRKKGSCAPLWFQMTVLCPATAFTPTDRRQNQPGNDADLDQAVRQIPLIYDALTQSPNDPRSTDPFTDLAMKLKAGEPVQ